MFSIGEFSKITGLTVKTLRFYHEQGLLTPSYVDEQTGYRYYDRSRIETARIIARLRELEFSLSEIAEILRHAGDDAQILDVMQRQRAQLAERIGRLQTAARAIDQFIQAETAGEMAMKTASFEVEEKMVEPQLVAAIRMRGKYSDCGPAFGRIGRQFGRFICGKPLLLHYDTEYREDDADFEACMPVRKAKAVDGISIHELPGGRCVSLLHKGPYDQLGRSYAKILQYVKDKGYELLSPTREVYIKSHGMIFKGNPKNYLTEIQMFPRSDV